MGVLRPLQHADLDALLEVQRDAAVVGLGHIFPQDRYPFSVPTIRARWQRELEDPEVDCFVIELDGAVAGFAATRGGELLHFGTALHAWGSGLAGRAHDEVLDHLRRHGHQRAWLKVFEENRRAVRFYSRRGWVSTGTTERSSFPPHALLRRLERDLVADVVVRDALPADVGALRAFGEAHVVPHYAPLIGTAAAQDQVRRWWNEEVLSIAVAAGQVLVAEVPGSDDVVGVAQVGRSGADAVVYKLYVHPDHRGRGLGVRLLDAVVDRLPDGAERLCIEHFAGNARAGAFYEREGFPVERVEPSATGDAALAVVWRARALGRSLRGGS